MALNAAIADSTTPKISNESGTVHKQAVNYFSVHATVPNRPVAANSDLFEELHTLLVEKSQNIKGEVVIPDDLDGFDGYDGQAARTHNGKAWAIPFGSKVD